MGVRPTVCARTRDHAFIHTLTLRLIGVRGLYGIFSAQRNTLVSRSVQNAFEELTLNALHAGIGMNAPGAISSTPSEISCPFHGLSSPLQMHTRGGLISSRE